MTAHCFSVDVEGYLEASVDSCPGAQKFLDPRKDAYEIQANVEAILELLADLEIRGTWFFLGRIALDQPHVVQSVVRLGHEIACHGMHHRRLIFVTPGALRAELMTARQVLEDVAGVAVSGFRAPDFSVTPESRWALDVIAEAGFLYDSSLVPTRLHDVYGMPDTEPGIHRLGNGVVEFPIGTLSLAGHRIPYAGGGYFRMLPVPLTRRLMRRAGRRGEPIMFYIHPYEVGPVLPTLPLLGPVQRFRYEFRTGRADRLRRLLEGFEFLPACEILDTALAEA